MSRSGIQGVLDQVMVDLVANRFRSADRNLNLVLIEIGRLVRFGFTGLVVTFVYAAVTIVLVEAGGVGAIAASIAGYLAAGGVSYLGHLYFSFSVRPDHRAYVWRFLIAATLSFVLTIVITWIVTQVLGFSARVSVPVVSILLPATSYVCNRFWVFLPGLKTAETNSVSYPPVATTTSDPS
jgi:putative flippase GtrA